MVSLRQARLVDKGYLASLVFKSARCVGAVVVRASISFGAVL